MSPKSLVKDEPYQRLYDKICQNEDPLQSQLAKSTLCWLVCAKELIFSDQFLSAICISQCENVSISHDQLVGLCRGLIVYNSILDVFQFADSPTRIFFEGLEEYSSTRANATIAAACLRVLFSSDRTSYLEDKSGSIIYEDSYVYRATIIRYALIYWGVHVKDSGKLRFDAPLCELLSQFLADGAEFEKPINVWSREFRRSSYYGKLPLSLGTMREHLSSCLPPGLLSASWLGFIDLMASKLADLALTSTTRAFFHNRLLYVFLSPTVMPSRETIPEHDDVASYLVRGSEIVKTERLLIDVAKYRGLQVMTDVLSQVEDKSLITEDVMIAAASNLANPTELLSLLLECKGSDFWISHALIRAAAMNRTHSASALCVILDRYKKPKMPAFIITDALDASAKLLSYTDIELQITSSVLEKAASKLPIDLFEALWQRAPHIPVSSGMIMSAISNSINSYNLLKTVLDRKQNSVEITTSMVEKAIATTDPLSLEILLGHCDPPYTLGERSFVPIYENRNHCNEIGLVLIHDNGRKDNLSPSVLDGNVWLNDMFVKTLYNEYSEQLELSQKALGWAVQCGTKASLDLALSRKVCTGTRVTNDIVIRAIRAQRDEDFMSWLVDKWDGSAEDMIRVLETAAQYCSKPIFEKILSKSGHAITIDIVLAALSNSNPDVGAHVVEQETKIEPADAPQIAGSSIIESNSEMFLRSAFKSSTSLAFLLSRAPEVINTAWDLATSKRTTLVSNINVEVLKLLIRLRDPDLTIEEIDAVTPLLLRKHGIASLLLEHWGHKMSLTRKVVLAITNNHHSRKILDAFERTLAERIGDLEMLVDSLELIVQKWDNVIEILRIILQKSTQLSGIATLERLKAAASNPDQDVIRYMLDRWEAGMPIPNDTISAAAANSNEGIMHHILTSGHPFEIRQETLEKAVEQMKPHVLQLISSYLDLRPRITTDILLKAANNQHNESALETLLFLADEPIITDEFLLATVTKMSTVAMHIVFSRRAVSTDLTQSLLVIAGRADWHPNSTGSGIIDCLLSHDVNAVISEEMIETAVSSYDHRAVASIQCLLDRAGPGILTSNVLVAAAKSMEVTKIFEAFLGYEPDLRISEEVLVSAARHGHGVALICLMNMFAHQSNIPTMVTPALFKAAVRNESMAPKLMRFLFNKGADALDNESYHDLLLVAASNIWHAEDLLTFLTKQNKRAEISQDVVEAAAQNRGYSFVANLMKVVLGLRATRTTITPDLLMMVAKCSRQPLDVLDYLLEYDNEAKITADIVSAMKAEFYKLKTGGVKEFYQKQFQRNRLTEEAIVEVNASMEQVCARLKIPNSQEYVLSNIPVSSSC